MSSTSNVVKGEASESETEEEVGNDIAIAFYTGMEGKQFKYRRGSRNVC